MSETQPISPEEIQTKTETDKKTEVLDLKLVQDLLEMHRSDIDGMYPDEEYNFIKFLREELSKDHIPEVAKAAQIFLKEYDAKKGEQNAN